MNLLRSSVRRRLTRGLHRTAAHLVVVSAALVVALTPAGPAHAAGAPARQGAVAPAPAGDGSVDDGVLRVLLFYKPNFHASNVEGRQAIRDLVTQLGAEYSQPVEIQETDDPAAFTTANLATKDAVAFMQTGGVLFNESQRAALEAYIRGGGGYFGQHYAGWSVGQSEHDVNPFYLRLVGAMSEGHPENPGVRSGRVVNEEAEHPLNAGLPAEINRNDEWYDWVVNPAPGVRTLLAVDESSVGSLGHNGTTHPVTWCQTIDSGRSWYSGLGHEGTAYAEPFIRTMMKNGLAYSTGLLEADCSPPAKDRQGSWSGVTPWPLVPINAALTGDGKVQSFGSVSSGCADANPYDWSGNGCVTQGGQMQIDVWDPTVDRTIGNVMAGVVPNSTYTDLFCSMQVQMPHRRSTFTVGGDDGLGGNAPNDAAIGVTSYSTNSGLRNEAPMNYPRWYPTGTTLPDGSVVVQGGSLKGGPGGPGVTTPERYDPQAGSSWKLLTGATSTAAYGDGGDGTPDENRWWYPRAFVAPGNGNVFSISGTQMFELDPSGDGQVTLRGTLPAGIANQGANGNPVGATSTATMYRPGKILQVGGGWWANGGGPAGARAGFTVDITGGTDAPVVAATQPMKHARHWATSTVMPDGNVIVTGGSRENNGNGGYVTNAEIWNPDSGEWTEVEVPHEHARLYHSVALLLPDGRIMVGGGGAPGPRNYTDVEFYSPSYLYDGDQLATRPEVTGVPQKIGYDGTFTAQTDSTVSRVTLVRNGSATHGFNNDQNFQDLAFSKNGSTLTIESPVDGTYAPPGAYMVFVFDEDGTPSVADIVQIDPTVEMDSPAPKVVDQFEYPRLPTSWQSGTYPNSVDVAPGNGRLSPWEVTRQVQLIRAADGSQGGLGLTGYHLAVGTNGSMTRTLAGLDVGREYRLSLRYARDSRSAGSAPGTANLSVGGLSADLSAGADLTSTTRFGTYVGTFTATSRQLDLTVSASSAAAGLVIDDLVVVGTESGASDVPVHYEFEEGSGTSASNTGTDGSVGGATLTGTTTWSANGVHGGAVDLQGGSNANAVDLPDNLLQGESDFTTSFWVRPDAMANWVGLFHIGDGLAGDGSFFQIQMQTDAAPGGTGLAATFKKKGSALQERVYASPTRDVVANQWNHVAFTRTGSTGTLYLNGEKVAQRTDLTITMADVGPTANNWLGRNGYPDPAFNGLVDDVRAYTSVLTDADIASLYAEGSALPTSVDVSITPASPSPYGEPITVSATVSAGPGPAPTGVAELWLDGAREGGQVDVAGGAVSFPAVTLAPGAHQVEVRFLADEGWRDSVKAVSHTVDRPPVGEGVPVHYTFDEGAGTAAANSGTDPSIGSATLQGNAGWTATAQYGAGVTLPGAGHVTLPNDITAGMDEQFTVSTWLRPTNLPNWTTHVQIGKSTQEFFLLQSRTENGTRGFAATLRADNGEQFRIQLPGTTDLPLNQWTHVVVTLGPSPTGGGTTGKIYFNGAPMAGGTRDNIPVDIGDIGLGGTGANFIGNTSWNDPRPTEQVDDFRIYGHELTAAEVLELFEGDTNAAPVGASDAYGTMEDQPLVVAAPGVLANDTDADGDGLTATAVTQPANGEVASAPNGGFTYTPDAGFFGTDTFTYRASDGTASSAATTVTITVEEDAQPANTAPVAADDAYDAVGGEPLVIPAPGVLANDTDADGNVVTTADVVQPANGKVTVAADGSFSYVSDAGFSGKDVFTYRADDGEDASAPARVTITVKSPAATAVAGVALPISYGTAGTVSVSVSPDTAAGQVELRAGTEVVALARVAEGRGTLVLPARSLRPGVYDLALRYLGDADHAPATSTVRVQVDRAVPTMEVTAAKASGGKATVIVALSAPNAVPVEGQVRIEIDGGATLTSTVSGGKTVFTLPKAPKGGQLTLTASYLGSDLVQQATSRVTVRVR